jgi:hypothetical protein
MAFCRENSLDVFGAPRRPGTGRYGEIPIIAIPRRAKGL